MDDAEKWLIENDPDIKDYTLRRKSEYPFHTAWQTFSRQQREIPISNLTAINHRIKIDDDDALYTKNSMG